MLRQNPRDLFSQFTTKEYRGHRQRLHSLKWSHDGRRIASGSVDRTAKLWSIDLSSAHTKRTIELKGHSDSVDQLCWSPNDDLLATASSDRSCKIWDTKSGKCIQTIQTAGANINITWSPDGNHIATGNKDDLISFIDTRTWETTKQIKYDTEINEIAWDPSGTRFFLTTGQGSVRILEYPSFEMLTSINAHTSNCYCLDFDSTKRYFAVGGADALVSLWDAQDLICVRTFSELVWPVRAISFSYDGQFLASASEDLFIDISDVSTGESVHKVKCFAATNTVCWHPSQYLLAFAGDEVNRGRDEGNMRIFGFKSASNHNS